VSLYDQLFSTHGAIYRSEPNVRTVVDFIARNAAQVGVKLYDRVGDNDRQELSKHPLTQLVNHPNPVTTRYRLFYGTYADLCIYDAAFWLKVLGATGRPGLLRVPPEYMQVAGGTIPTKYRLWFPGGEPQFFDPSEVVHFHGYDPTSLTGGVSPMETLKGIIAEDTLSAEHRKGFWKRGARMEGVILRPGTAAELSTEAKNRFLEEWEATYSGKDNSGRTGMLEEDMQWLPVGFSPKESEYVASRKLTMEVVARSFHLPLQMVGLGQANYSSIDEYHKMLYTESLPPWFTWVEEDMELQLFNDYSGLENAYLEHNIAEKLKGSFEAQAAILSTSVGGPWMTTNEARARVNLPPLDNGDDLIVPMNVTLGGQPAPNQPLQDGGDREEVTGVPGKSLTKALAERVRDKYEVAHEELFTKFFTHQRDVVLSAQGAGRVASTQKAAKGFDSRRWNKELQEDLGPLALEATTAAGTAAARRFGSDGTYDPDATKHYLAENVRIAAESVNASTEKAVDEAVDSDALKRVFEVAIVARAAQLALTRSTSLVTFATHEAAKQSGKTTKTWSVTSANSRHPELDGETVKVFEEFSNGAQYPGDPSLDVGESAGCTCLLDFG